MLPKKKKPKAYCSVLGCKITSMNSPDTHFYSFPSLLHKLKRRQDWIDAIRNHHIRQAQWEPTKDSRICCHHFVGGQKSENPKSLAYNPTIFPEICGKSTSARPKRYRKRKIQLDDENLENDGLPANSTATKNLATQVNFDDKIYYHNLNSFSCKLYITDTTCEAEVQTSIQRASKYRTTKLEYVDKSTNTNFRSHDKSCGTDPVIYDRNILLKRLFTYDISSITSDREMLNIAGTTFSVFHMLLKILNRQNLEVYNSDIPIDKSLLIFLMRMKTGLPFSAISSIVGVNRATVSHIFYVTLMNLTAACKRFVLWPSREVVQETMPEAFEQSYKDCRVIIDCFEMPVEEPSSDKLKVKFYSDRTNSFTIKVLVGYTPNGLVSFISRCFPGSTIESEIVNRCGILHLLNAGDTVIAGKVFSEIKKAVEDNEQEINVVRLAFTKNPSSAEDEIQDIDKIRRVVIDLKKLMRRIKAYKILDKLRVHMYPDSDSILFMCAVLVNFQIIRQL